MRKKILFALLLVIGIIAVTTMPKMVEGSIPTVYYVTPKIRKYENVVNCSGTVQSGEVRQIYLQSPAIAQEISVTVGDTVQKGDTLLKIDKEKTQSLPVIPMELFREISSDIPSSASNIDWAAIAASYGLNAAVSGGDISSIDPQLIEQVIGKNATQTAAKYASIAETSADGEIKAPISGVITEIDIQEDVPASSGKSILTIADNKNYKVIASVREEDIAKIQLHDFATVRGVGFAGISYSGRISKIYPTAHKTFNGTNSETVVDVEITLDNPDKKLKSGFTAKVEIAGGSDLNLITVPYEAIKQDENNNEYVYLYQDGRLIKQVVITGQELTDEVEIIQGVDYNSVVVYNPTDAVKEGAMIHIKGRADAD